MHKSTKKWLFMKCSSLSLIPLMIWFIINFVSIYDKDYIEVINFFNEHTSKILFSLFIAVSYFFFVLTISEIFEDYINDEKIKNVANKVLYASAVVIPLITIILISKL